MKIAIPLTGRADCLLVVELLSIAGTQYADDVANKENEQRLRDQFRRQRDGARALYEQATMCLWAGWPWQLLFVGNAQTGEGEAGRWLVLNALEAGIAALEREMSVLPPGGYERALLLQRIARGNQLREAIEDAPWQG